MTPILPGATLGMLGSGQLGRMFAIAARRLGYRVEVYSPEEETPAGQVADAEWVADYTDTDALQRFAQQVDVVSLEFENIDVVALEAVEHFVPVRPGPLTLHTSQHRGREKTALRHMGLPTAPFRLVESAEQLQQGLHEFGECILKTAAWGYDGKGQQRLQGHEDAAAIWSQFATEAAVLEGLVRFTCEFSVIGVRGVNGEVRLYEPIVNTHVNHILDLSVSPALELSEPVRRRAQEMTRTILETLKTIGVLCVEFFLSEQGEPIINEIAPRPHNSGHLTIDAHVTCQFEQQVRAICGLPLGSTAQRQPAAMTNLLGDLWPTVGTPDWVYVLQQPLVKLHLYGKAEARPGRKMGHLTALGSTAEEAQEIALAARQLLISERWPRNPRSQKS